MFEQREPSSMPRKILAIETSSEACSVAVSYAGDTLFRHIDQPRQHAQRVLPMVQELMQESGLSLVEFDAIAFGRGPGAFTGLRIAAGIVQGLAYGADLPVAAVSSLAVLAHRAGREWGAQHVHAAFDARMGEVYWGSYEIGGPGQVTLVGRECVCAPDDVAAAAGVKPAAGWSGAGSGWIYQKPLELSTGALQHCEPLLLPHSLDLLALADTALVAGELITAEQVLPVYLRNNVAEKSKK